MPLMSWMTLFNLYKYIFRNLDKICIEHFANLMDNSLSLAKPCAFPIGLQIKYSSQDKSFFCYPKKKSFQEKGK